MDGECNYCKKHGHRIADCFKRANANQLSQNQASQGHSSNDWNQRNDNSRRSNNNSSRGNSYRNSNWDGRNRPLIQIQLRLTISAKLKAIQLKQELSILIRSRIAFIY